MAFEKAEKSQGRLRIALTGPSGSGKTYSGLLIATGIVEAMKKMGLDTGKGIAVIDTENGSAADYADRFEFDLLKMEAPYTVEKYIAGVQEAYGLKYSVLLLDSITHEWAGEGGIIQRKDSMDARGGNHFTNWVGFTKEHEQFKNMILNNKVHLIATMRSKQDYVMEQNAKGKEAPKKVGMAPVQRDGMEYEFTTVLDLSMKHEAMSSKDRTGLFDGTFFRPTKETGVLLLEWRMSGKPEKPEAPAPAPAAATPTPAAPPAQSPTKSAVFKVSAVTSIPSTKPGMEGVMVYQVVLIDGKDNGGAIIMKTNVAAHASTLQAAEKDKADVTVTWRVIGPPKEAIAVIQTVEILDSVSA